MKDNDVFHLIVVLKNNLGLVVVSRNSRDIYSIRLYFKASGFLKKVIRGGNPGQ